MTKEEQQAYKDEMKSKAFSYAKERVGDIAKAMLPKEEYEQIVLELANAFAAGVDASVNWMKEYSNNIHRV